MIFILEFASSSFSCRVRKFGEESVARVTD